VLDRGGSILPFGGAQDGHKGAGLSLAAELLGSVLAGGAVLGQVESKAAAGNWGHLVIALSPALLQLTPADGADPAAYARKVESVLGKVRASGVGIRLPGDGSNRQAAANEEAGVLKLPDALWASLQKHSRL
jgi:LDH2 family malate/lactate/ureidoglycolate dehydrogenase